MTSAELRAWQQRLGMTNARAAASLNVPLRTYEKWIIGKPDRELANQLLDAVTHHVEHCKPGET